jgi:hypothetical protein
MAPGPNAGERTQHEVRMAARRPAWEQGDAAAGRDDLGHDRELVHPVHQLGTVAGGGRDGLDQGEDGEAVVDRHPRLGGHVPRREARLGGERVAGGEGHVQRLMEQRRGRDRAGPGWRVVEAVGEDEVIVAGELGEAFLRDVLVRESQPRCLSAGQATQQRGKEDETRAVERRDGHSSGGLVNELLHRLTCPSQGRFDFDRGVGQRLPGRGEREATPGPFSQRHANRALQKPELLRDRRRRHEQGLGDSRDATELSQFAKDAELTFVHDAIV